jgi:dienelactone hydrolase
MWKKVSKIAFCALLGLMALLWAHKAHRDAHYFDNYDPSAPLNVSVLDKEEVNRDAPDKGYTITKFTFDGYKGEKIPTLMSVPMKHTDKPLPVVIFLHGIGQSKSFLRQITAPFNQTGFALVSFDQSMQGERKLPKKSPILTFLKAFQQRPAKTVNETRRLVDYLETCPDIDPKRIYLVGASYGAVMGSTVLAKDKRIRAGVLVYGGGDLRLLLDSYANHLAIAVALHLIDGKGIDAEKPPLPKLAASQERVVGAVIGCIIPIARYFVGACDPIYYVDKIAPTPVYFQNGLHDNLVPAAAGHALQDAAKEPKKITWYESDHVGINVEQTKQVLTDDLRWLLEQDGPFRGPEENVTELPLFDMKKP